MKKDELPYLNLDAATSLYLPLEPIEARAHHRFAFRLPNGDEEWLLARLCLVKPDARSRLDAYCIVLCPEQAEEGRIFVADNISLHTEEFSDTSYMAGADAPDFNWDLYAECFHHDQYNPQLSRYCIIELPQKVVLIKFSIGGLATVDGLVNKESKSVQKPEGKRIRFRWRRSRWKSNRTEADYNFSDLRFLRFKDDAFQGIIRNQRNNPNSNLRYALRWMDLNENERDTVAFQCENGSWEDLISLATMVLQVRISHQGSVQSSTFHWDFHHFWISVSGNDSLRDDRALTLWRFALTTIFGTITLVRKGMKKYFHPLVVSDHLSQNTKTQITAEPLSMHELMEANLKIEAWAKHNFSEENARILMDCLQNYSGAEAQKLYLTFDDSNLLQAPIKWPTVDPEDSEIMISATQYLLRGRGFYQAQIDGSLGPKTASAVKAFQKSQGLKANGVLGPKTLSFLVTTVERGSNGDAVRAAQLLVLSTVKRTRTMSSIVISELNGIFDAETENIVMLAQAHENRIENRLREDGIIGPRTWCLLFGGKVVGQKY